MKKLIFSIGETVINLAVFFARHTEFSIKLCVRGTLASRLTNPAVMNMAARNIFFAGVELLPLMTIMSLILGLFLVGELSKFLLLLGIGDSIGSVLLTVIIRFAAPLTTGLLLLLRTSTTFLIEIGLMKSNGEMNTLEAMDIDPYIYVYFPRVIASTISMICLSTYFSVISITGGYILLSFQLDTTLDTILSQVFYEISFSDIGSFIFKTTFIGFFAGTIPIYMAIEASNYRIDIIKSFTRGMVRLFFAFVITMAIGELI